MKVGLTGKKPSNQSVGCTYAQAASIPTIASRCSRHHANSARDRNDRTAARSYPLSHGRSGSVAGSFHPSIHQCPCAIMTLTIPVCVSVRVVCMWLVSLISCARPLCCVSALCCTFACVGVRCCCCCCNRMCSNVSETSFVVVRITGFASGVVGFVCEICNTFLHSFVQSPQFALSKYQHGTKPRQNGEPHKWEGG